MENRKRLLFFDLLRIVSVGLIVYGHIARDVTWLPIYTPSNFLNIFYLHIGNVGVLLLVFVSGAVLEYNYKGLDHYRDILTFYAKRMARIYPAFWMSLILGLALAPILLYRPATVLLSEFSGFNAWGGNWGGAINPCGWFIGLIVSLYLLFPFLSAAIRKYPYLMLILMGVAEISFRWVFINHGIPGFAHTPEKWFPICNFLEFGLGIWIIQQGIIPKKTHANASIIFLAEISFYVFLIHLIAGMPEIMVMSLPFYILLVAFFSWLMMLADRRIQELLKKK